MSKKKKNLYLDEHEKELEKSDKQVADIWRNMITGFSSGLGGITLSEIAKGFELDDELLGLIGDETRMEIFGENKKDLIKTLKEKLDNGEIK